MRTASAPRRAFIAMWSCAVACAVAGGATLSAGCSSLLGVDFDSAKARLDAGADGGGNDADGATTAGGCVSSCAPEVCDEGKCVATCGGSRTACGGTCTTLASDPMNCGLCGYACPVPVGATASCNNNTCAFACSDGYSLCQGGYACCVNGTDAGGGLLPTTAIAIATGFQHACAVAVDGSVRCWGDNSSGQLGNGTGGDGGPHPVAVSGLTGATAVAAGVSHTCAIVANGAVKCWGDNFYGELGSGNISVGNNKPVDVVALTNASAIALGERHSCALVNGGVQCWGDNEYGQLGIGSGQASTTAPTAVPTLGSGVTAIGASDYTTCALQGSNVYCWGNNVLGQIGDGAKEGGVDYTPYKVLSGAAVLGTGSQTVCAELASSIECWGYNSKGQIVGTADGANLLPTALVGITQASILAVGDAHACGLTSGGVRCWGDDMRGQLGSGTASGDKDRPVTPVIGLLAGTKALSAAADYTCALAGNGKVQCWGTNANGQLGSAMSTTYVAAPTEVEGL